MPKKMGIVFVLTGAVLILSALLLFLNNTAEDVQAGKEAEAVMMDVQSIIADRKNNKDNDVTSGTSSSTPEKTEAEDLSDSAGSAAIPEADSATKVLPEEETLPAVDIQGYSCIGMLSIPAIEIELPVLENWSYNRLKIAPCRQFGSPATEDFVIAAHNYKNHFGLLSELVIGDKVMFTDMDGVEYHYELVRLETIDPTAIADVRDSGCALVLYTCTYGGSNRIAAFFNPIAE